MQELYNCIIDKTELTSLIVGGDWNCTLSKKDKIGGALWRPSDLVDIQRARHPKLRKFTYESKYLRSTSFSLRKTSHYPAIAPDYDAIFISLSLPNQCPRGPGFWKFNNTLLNDEQYVSTVRDTYTCKHVTNLF